MTNPAIFPQISPPETEERPIEDTRHGITRTDEYAWLRADNWQEVFRDPSVLDPAIRAHLEAENAYQAALMADTAELRKQLFDEMKGRIKEDDSSVPMKDGPFAYGSSFRIGGEQPRYFRTPRDGGAEDIMLDGDVEAEGKPYFRLGGVDHSADHRKLLWAFDDKGSEFFTLRVRDLDDGKEHDDQCSRHRRRRASGTPPMTASSIPGSTPTTARRRCFFHTLGTDAAERPAGLSRRPIPASS